MTPDAPTTTTERLEFTDSMASRMRDVVREFQALELQQMRKGEIAARAHLAEVRKPVDKQRAEARRRLRRARSGSQDAWEETAKGLQEAWRELREAVDEARARLEGGADAGNE